MDLLINAANVLYVIAYFTTDMRRLRAMTLVAAACLAIYFASLPEPLWTAVGWNLFFLGLNIVQLGRLTLAARSVAAGEFFIDGARSADVLGRVDGAHDAAAGDVDGAHSAAAHHAYIPAFGVGDAPRHAGLGRGDHGDLILDQQVLGDELLVIGGRWVDPP